MYFIGNRKRAMRISYWRSISKCWMHQSSPLGSSSEALLLPYARIGLLTGLTVSAMASLNRCWRRGGLARPSPRRRPGRHQGSPYSRSGTLPIQAALEVHSSSWSSTFDDDVLRELGPLPEGLGVEYNPRSMQTGIRLVQGLLANRHGVHCLLRGYPFEDTRRSQWKLNLSVCVFLLQSSQYLLTKR